MSQDKTLSASVISLPVVGQDNLIYLLPDPCGGCIAIDPGWAEPVMVALRQYRLTLTHILLTHHHGDHIGGVELLAGQTGCHVIGTDSQRIAAITDPVTDQQEITLNGLQIHVLLTTGHTRTSTCFYIPSQNDHEGMVFTGDTLFVGGCGRLFECDAQTLYQSLQTLAALPDETLVFCGHDYTLENYRFALTVDRDNPALCRRLAELELHGSGIAIPSTLGFEKQTNPFLRADSPAIRAALGMPDQPAWQVFAELRTRKNRF